ncbi:hypothetical protein OAJ94_04210 [Deltaproteobacteria bacterium]|nr:hypothetical protein [Deltaproteobacteria bacterium]
MATPLYTALRSGRGIIQAKGYNILQCQLMYNKQRITAAEWVKGWPFLNNWTESTSNLSGELSNSSIRMGYFRRFEKNRIHFEQSKQSPS